MEDMDERFLKFKGYKGEELEAFLVSPEKFEVGVIVIHEIWGLTEYIKNVARRIAQLGYLSIAPNLYRAKELNEENIAKVMRRLWSLPQEKRNDKEFLYSVYSSLSEQEKVVFRELVENRAKTEERMIEDLKGAYSLLSNIGAKKFGVIGFCMGGGLSFQLSTELQFNATVIYYGRNPWNLDDLNKIKGGVLGIYAGEDYNINQGLPELMRAVIKYKTDFEMKLYPNTYHAFATEGGPVYNEVAAKDAWERTVRFFKKYLG
jgi:carboxymethylenebutenolidase